VGVLVDSQLTMTDHVTLAACHGVRRGRSGGQPADYATVSDVGVLVDSQLSMADHVTLAVCHGVRRGRSGGQPAEYG